jgi:hypothetical protein
MRPSTSMHRRISQLSMLVLLAGVVAAASVRARQPIRAASILDGRIPVRTAFRFAERASVVRAMGTSGVPDQSTALPPAGTPIPTRDFVVAGTLWLPHVILSRPQVIPRPTLRISPTPRASATPDGTREPTPLLPTTTVTAIVATATGAPPTPTRTAVPPTIVPPTATTVPTVAPPSATPLLCILAEREPNNAILEALDQPPLCPDQPGSGALPEGDVTDYFRLELSTPGLIVADLGTLPVGTNYDLYLYTRQGQLLAISQLPDNQAEHVEVRVTVAGDFYVRVYASSGRSTEAYTVSWSLRP